MLEDYTREQRWQFYERLPEDLKEAIWSEKIADINWDLAQKYEFIDKVSIFAGLVGDVLLGILPPDQFKEKLGKDLLLDPEVSEALFQEVEKLIFDPVRESLDKLYKGEVMGTKESVKKTKSKGYDDYIKVIALELSRGSDNEILWHANKAIELGLSTSEEVYVRTCIGSVYLRQGRLQEAETEIKRALKLDEESEKKLNALSYFCACRDLARIYEEKGDITLAIKCLEDTIVRMQARYDPNEEKGAIAMAFVELGACYLRHRSKLISADDQAFLNFQRAMETCDISDVYMYLGILHGSKEIPKYYDPEKAIRYYEQCLTRIGSPESDDANTEVIRKMAEKELEWLRREVKIKKKGFFQKLCVKR